MNQRSQGIEYGTFVVRLPDFVGTMGDLLHDVLEHRLAADAIPAAEVLRQFQAYVNDTEEDRLELVAEYVPAASRLLLAKSQALLSNPEQQEQQNTTSLREALQPIAHIREMAGDLAAAQGFESFPGADRGSRYERDIRPLSSQSLTRAMEAIRQRVESSAVKIQPPAFVRLEVALSTLIRRLRTAPRITFSDIARRSSRQDAVVHFLAVLELSRRRQADVQQHGLFQEIVVEARQSLDDESVRAG